MKKLTSLLLTLCLLTALAPAALAATYEIRPLVGTATDYSVESNWMHIAKDISREVDLFYIYPTVYFDESGTDLAAIDDPVVRMSAQAAYDKTGSAIGASTNVFAPYYRQTNLRIARGLTGEEYEEYSMGEQRTDIYAALDYYFENWNEGRPFILAGHSQGSCMLKIVLGEYMQLHPEYLERMVAAYVIGFSITESWLKEHPYLKFAEGADDTGVIVSWNAEGPNNHGPSLILEDGAISINPINWKRDETKAEASESLGSRTMDMTEAGRRLAASEIKSADDLNAMWKVVPGVADAAVDLARGTVVCTTAPAAFNDETQVFGPESYHSHDYDFYYLDIQENAKMRIASYLAAHGQKQAKPVVTVYGHRGAQEVAPENTLSSFRSAYALGSDGFETDIQMTGDGQLVIHHNYRIDVDSNGVGELSDMTVAELKEYDFGSWFDPKFIGERIATLEECLEVAQLFDTVNLELKAPMDGNDAAYIRMVADAIESAGLTERVVVSAFKHSLLKQLKEILPEVKVGALTMLATGFDFDLGDYLPREKKLNEIGVDDIISPVPQEVVDMITGYGGIHGDSSEAIVAELVSAIAAMYPSETWEEAAAAIQAQADLTAYVDSLDFQLDYLHPMYLSCQMDPKLVAKMHARSIGVNAWTANTADVIQMLMDLGVDGVITDRPDLAMELQGRGNSPVPTDVSVLDWYFDGACYAVKNGIIAPRANGSFDPSDTVTRGDAAYFIWNIAGKPSADRNIKFTDVSENDWNAEAIRWAVSSDLIETDGDQFAPDDVVTREQFAEMLYRYAKQNGQGFTGAWMFLLRHPDASDISESADEAMHWMVMHGIINGLDGKLNPQGATTRAQVATMLMRYCTTR